MGRRTDVRRSAPGRPRGGVESTGLHRLPAGPGRGPAGRDALGADVRPSEERPLGEGHRGRHGRPGRGGDPRPPPPAGPARRVGFRRSGRLPGTRPPRRPVPVPPGLRAGHAQPLGRATFKVLPPCISGKRGRRRRTTPSSPRSRSGPGRSSTRGRRRRGATRMCACSGRTRSTNSGPGGSGCRGSGRSGSTSPTRAKLVTDTTAGQLHLYPDARRTRSSGSGRTTWNG